MLMKLQAYQIFMQFKEHNLKCFFVLDLENAYINAKNVLNNNQDEGTTTKILSALPFKAWLHYIF